MDKWRIAREALADLREISDYIRRDNPTAADEWISTLLEKFDKLADSRGLRSCDSLYSALLLIPFARTILLGINGCGQRETLRNGGANQPISPQPYCKY